MAEQQGVCAFVPPEFRRGTPAAVFGMGILIEGGLVLTCAHVVEAILGGPPDPDGAPPLRVWFPFGPAGATVAGSVDTTRWYAVDAAGEPSDVAIVRLTGPVPKGVAPARLAGHALGSTVQAFGFRSKVVDGRRLVSDRGEWARGAVAGAAVGGRVQSDRLALTGVGVEPGFSGAGVYDAAQDAVVGMMTEVDATPDRAFFRFIDTAVLRLALRPDDGSDPPPRTLEPGKIDAAKARLAAIAGHLESVTAHTPAPVADQRSRDYLLALLRGTGDALAGVRAGFGLPAAPAAAQALASVVAQDEPSTRPLAGILAQRLYHVLWRVHSTLALIREPWAAPAQSKVRALQRMADPDTLARSPTLAHLHSALKARSDLTPFAEPGPDPALYTVLRALGDTASRRSGLSPAAERQARELALEYVHATLVTVLEQGRRIDDTSNAWWAVRTGICLGDARFRALLPAVADRLHATAAHAEALRGTAVPEIYTAERAAAYTLSNVQAIVEAAPDLDASILRQLHVIVEDMSGRLLDAPPATHLYLAAVRYEALGNYLDYARQLRPGQL